jgi:hypothetical protein
VQKHTIVPVTELKSDVSTYALHNEFQEFDEHCFVCGMLAGSGLVCDFPLCTKVYHHSCVCKVNAS